jgi:hypothetical protein
MKAGSVKYVDLSRCCSEGGQCNAGVAPAHVVYACTFAECRSSRQTQACARVAVVVVTNYILHVVHVIHSAEPSAENAPIFFPRLQRGVIPPPSISTSWIVGSDPPVIQTTPTHTT